MVPHSRWLLAGAVLLGALASVLPAVSNAQNVETYTDQVTPPPTNEWPYTVPLRSLKADDWGIGAKAREKYEELKRRPYMGSSTQLTKEPTAPPGAATVSSLGTVSSSSGAVELKPPQMVPLTAKDLTQALVDTPSGQQTTQRPIFTPQGGAPDIRPMDASGNCVTRTVEWTRACAEVGYPPSFQGKVVGQTRVICPKGDLEDTWLTNTCAPEGTTPEDLKVLSGPGSDTIVPVPDKPVLEQPTQKLAAPAMPPPGVTMGSPPQYLQPPSTLKTVEQPGQPRTVVVDSKAPPSAATVPVPDNELQYEVKVMPGGEAIVTPVKRSGGTVQPLPGMPSPVAQPAPQTTQVISVAPQAQPQPQVTSKMVPMPTVAAQPSSGGSRAGMISTDFTASVLASPGSASAMQPVQETTAQLTTPQLTPPQMPEQVQAQPQAMPQMPAPLATTTTPSSSVTVTSVSPLVEAPANTGPNPVTIQRAMPDVQPEPPAALPQSMTQAPASQPGVVGVDGQCGPSHGATLGTKPTGGLCAVGNASEVSGLGPWVWTCLGLNNGGQASCQANAVIGEGRCGAANGAPAGRVPTANLCESGASSPVTGEGPWSWTCNGAGGGKSSNCAAPFLPADKLPSLDSPDTFGDLSLPPAEFMKTDAPLPQPQPGLGEGQVNRPTPQAAPAPEAKPEPKPEAKMEQPAAPAVSVEQPKPETMAAPAPTPAPVVTSSAVSVDTSLCGRAAKVATVMEPGTDFCASGSAGDVTGEGPWTWTCKDGDKTSTCTAPLPTLAECGAAHGKPMSKAPANDLCLQGTASIVAGIGPWTWNCDGGEGGTAVSCSAPIGAGEAPVPSASPSIPVQRGTALESSSHIVQVSNRAATVDAADAARGGPVDGLCGIASEDSVKPTEGMCTEGAASKISGKGPWNWTCQGEAGGQTVACKTVKPGQEAKAKGKTRNAKGKGIEGVCGGANAQVLTAQPAVKDLCKGGIASLVRGQGPWTWTWACVGLDGGNTVTCVAAMQDAPGGTTVANNNVQSPQPVLATQAVTVAQTAEPAAQARQTVQMAVQPPSIDKPAPKIGDLLQAGLVTPQLNEVPQAAAPMQLTPPTPQPPSPITVTSTVVTAPMAAPAQSGSAATTTNIAAPGASNYAPETPIRSSGLPDAPALNVKTSLSGVSVAAERLGSINFSGQSSDIGSGDQRRLGEFAAAMRGNPGARVIVTAYAESGDVSTREARRISLSRAVAVRDYLMQEGIEGSRIDLRAQGANVSEGNPNRADVHQQ